MGDPVRIAMWSGPRNLSTAMMYSFAQRADCAVTDEPFYAAYLAATGNDHPMRDEVLASQPLDPAQVAAECLGPVPGDRPVWYQKHMTHHMLEGFPLDWIAKVRNVFLIRHPARVVASYARKREALTLDDIGFETQCALYERVIALGQVPVVVDSASILADPEPALRVLCEAIDLAFDPVMLKWEAGPRPEDGVWARHWYGAVHRSTGFDIGEAPLPELEGDYAVLAERALPFYERMRAAI